MRDQPDHIACAAATANGFAMPYRRSTPQAHVEKERTFNEKEALQLLASRSADVDAPSWRRA